MSEHIISAIKDSKFNFKVFFVVVSGLALCYLLMPDAAFASFSLGAEGDKMINAVKSIFSTLVTFGGAALGVWAAIKLGIAIKDSNGPGISDAVMMLVGALIVCAAGVFFGTLNPVG